MYQQQKTQLPLNEEIVLLIHSLNQAESASPKLRRPNSVVYCMNAIEIMQRYGLSNH
jgi:hypothetical protein